MNSIRKILNDILEDINTYRLTQKRDDTVVGIYVVEDIIRSHMNDITKCDKCNRRKWYQMGYNDGFEAQHEKWIPVSSGKFPPDSEEVFITYQKKDDPNDRHIAGGISIGKHWILPFGYFNSNYEVVAWMPMIDEYEGE